MISPLEYDINANRDSKSYSCSTHLIYSESYGDWYITDEFSVPSSPTNHVKRFFLRVEFSGEKFTVLPTLWVPVVFFCLREMF